MNTPTLRFVVACCIALVAASSMAQSLYSESTYRPLTADNKAYRVGDVLTIQIVENAAASANADTATRRSNEVSAGLTRAHVPPIGVGLGTSGEFDGGGKTTRTGKLLAQLSVQVKQVLPNGDLQVAGEQLLLINDEGRVRPQDIAENNIVPSSRLAAARITYVGDGELADRQKPAWWRQLIDWIGL